MPDVSTSRPARRRPDGGRSNTRRHRTAVLAGAVALGLLSALVTAAGPAQADDEAPDGTVDIASQCYTVAHGDWGPASGFTVSAAATQLHVTVPPLFGTASNGGSWFWSLEGPSGTVSAPEFELDPSGEFTVDVPAGFIDPATPVGTQLNLRISGFSGGCVLDNDYPVTSTVLRVAIPVVATGPTVVDLALREADASFIDGPFVPYQANWSYHSVETDIPAVWGETVTVDAIDGFFTHGPEETWENTTITAQVQPYFDAGPPIDIPVQRGLDGTDAIVTLPAENPSDLLTDPDEFDPWDFGAKVRIVVSDDAGHGSLVVYVATNILDTAVSGTVPVISGDAVVGSTLTADIGEWEPGADLALQWFSGGTPVPGETGASYVVRPDDVTFMIAVEVTGTKAGSAPTVLRSEYTDAVVGGVLTPSTPTITGTVRVGSTLTAVPGVWGPATTTYAYQWLRSGSPIAGATDAQYVPQRADLGRKISVAVAASAPGYTAVSATSAKVKVKIGLFAGGAPTVSGTARAGSTLTAATHWTPSPTVLHYTWFRNGRPIAGAHGATYTLRRADAGHRIRVVVVGCAPGYLPVVGTSSAVRVR